MLFDWIGAFIGDAINVTFLLIFNDVLAGIADTFWSIVGGLFGF